MGGRGVKPTGVTEHPGASAEDVAEYLGHTLRAAIDARGRASLAVSGGKSPVPIFQALSNQDLDWSKVIVSLVDERLVPHAHDASNTALVARHLMQGRARAARFVPFFDEAGPLWDGKRLAPLLADSARRLADQPWPLDVVVLGMGEDAHTASLFPDGTGYHHAITTDARLAGVIPTTAPHARITLTLSALLAARELVLCFSGDRKRAVYGRCREKSDPALPLSLILNQTRTPVSVWTG